MTPEDIQMIRQVLPEDQTFPYYPDRESPWLMAQRMGASARVRDVKAGPLAAFLERPLVKPLAAGSGGVLQQADLVALAHADRAAALPEVSKPARDGLEQIYAGPWQDYLVTLSDWGMAGNWRWQQLSRPGGNLVLQLGFPSDHSAVLGRMGKRFDRSTYEWSSHPVRVEGRPTLAWVRLDIDLSTGTALIEEVQTDWLRGAQEDADYYGTAQTRQARVARDYASELSRRYAKGWQNVALLAALSLLVVELGVRGVWMHQHEPGAILKSIYGAKPPRSLYTKLPRRFGFRPTREAPPFLARPRKRDLAKLAKARGPLFWRLDLAP